MQRCSSLEGALVVEGLMFMRISYTFLTLSLITAGAAFGADAPKASAGSAVDFSAASHPLHLAVWNSDFNTPSKNHFADLPPLLTPVDNSLPAEHAGADVPQNAPVEAVPTPTAVASGMLVLGGMAGLRLFRRLRTA
jgi:hypothetical protein